MLELSDEFLCTYRAIGGDVSTDGDFVIFEGNRYSRKGFLFKSFAMSAIVSGCFKTVSEGAHTLIYFLTWLLCVLF